MKTSYLTRTELYQRVGEHLGIALVAPGQTREGNSQSKPLKEYALDDRLLGILAERGIVRQPRPDGVFTLVDENSQDPSPRGSSPSNYWNFQFQETESMGGTFNLRICLCIRLESRVVGEAGCLVLPCAYGTFLSPSDELPNARMFRALTESDPDAPALAKRMAAADDGKIFVT